MPISAPVLRGVTLPAPNRHERTPEDVYGTTTLAGGGEVRYVRGRRYTYSLAWSAMTEANLAVLRSAVTSFGRVPFVTVEGELVTVVVDGPPREEILPGTVPTRYRVDLRLREPDLRSAFPGTV